MSITDEQRAHALDETRRSWNQATRNHNTHKGDQAAKLRAGQSTLFPEELALLGDVHAHTLVHLQCNAGQHTPSHPHHGAHVTRVDLSDAAIRSPHATAPSSDIASHVRDHDAVHCMR